MIRDEEEEEERMEVAAESVERLESQVRVERERSERLREEVGKQALENRRLTSALAQARTTLQGDVLEENENLRAEIRKWKNIARHINVELIEHDKEVLKIMHQTSRTRLAWERDVALNRQGIFASKLSSQENVAKRVREETERELLSKFEEDLAPERKRREEAEAKARDLTQRLAQLEKAFSDASKVNKALAESQAEILEELEREREAHRAMTPRKVQQNTEKMRKRNRDLHRELEELRAVHYEKEAEMRDLKKSMKEGESSAQAAPKPEQASAFAQTDQQGALPDNTEEVENLKKIAKRKDEIIEAYKHKETKQASLIEKQRVQIEKQVDKQRSKMEKKLRKASKFISSLQDKRLQAKILSNWVRSAREFQGMKKQWKAGLVCTYFSMYHHRRRNAQLVRHSMLAWRASVGTSVGVKWLRVVHRALALIRRQSQSSLSAAPALSLVKSGAKSTVARSIVVRKFPRIANLASLHFGPSVSPKRVAFQVWKSALIEKKLVCDVKGLKVATNVLLIQIRDTRTRQILRWWKDWSAKEARREEGGTGETPAPASGAAGGQEEEKGEASEVTFVDKVGSDVIIKFRKEESALQTILDKVQEILNGELRDLQATVAAEVNRIVSSGTKATAASKHKLQTRLLQVEMTCTKLLEGLLAIDRTLESGGAGSRALGGEEKNLSRDVHRVVSDLKEIKARAHQALTSLEGLDRKVAVGHRHLLIKASEVPKRVVYLYDSAAHKGQDEIQSNFKHPEWTNQLPVFMPIE